MREAKSYVRATALCDCAGKKSVSDRLTNGGHSLLIPGRATMTAGHFGDASVNVEVRNGRFGSWRGGVAG